MSKKLHVKTGDVVVVLTGKYCGKRGKILSVNRYEKKVIVEGISLATKHKKPKKSGEVGGIIKKETPIFACKVMNVCPKCGVPSRIGRRIIENNKHVRYCKKCNENYNN
ncbi:MAG: 50S ribosomal protein L24 [Clostridiales bacterium]|nr:50S ribosomal protein L24 [Clostridiales bacterium]